MNLLQKLFGKKSKSKIKIKQSDKSSYFPDKKAPIDEKFTYNFNNNGGKFLYCINMDEILESFYSILEENNIDESNIYCINKNLEDRFKGEGFNTEKFTENSFFLSTCESLVANNGAILLSSNQIKEKKLNELPISFIIFATTSQLVESISEGLRNIKNKSKNLIPSNITTIQDFETEKEKDFMSYGSSTKNLYLLLLEDL